MNKKTLQALKDLSTDIGPVFESETKLETVELSEGEIEAKPTQYGYYLNIKDDNTSYAVNVRGVEKDKLGDTKKFVLEIWTAIKPRPAAGTRREIKVGDKRIFAIPA